jgi:protein-tyrosine-phosphatase/DNA-binding transcriptional ArsR family regulator
VLAKELETSSARFLQLVADPQRWMLLRELALSDRRVGELTERVGKPQNLVSYHLGELRSGGLISSRRSSADGRDTYYRIDLTRCREMFVEAGVALHPGLGLDRHPPTPTTTRTREHRVLFLCTGNSARSQMAEAMLEHRSAHAIEARSAGSHPKPLHPTAVRVMAERGIDIAGRPTKHFSRFARSRFDQIITLCDKVKEICPDLPGRPSTTHWSMADPSAEPDATYPSFVRTADEIEERVEFLIAQIVAER